MGTQPFVAKNLTGPQSTTGIFVSVLTVKKFGLRNGERNTRSCLKPSITFYIQFEVFSLKIVGFLVQR